MISKPRARGQGSNRGRGAGQAPCPGGSPGLLFTSVGVRARTGLSDQKCKKWAQLCFYMILIISSDELDVILVKYMLHFSISGQECNVNIFSSILQSFVPPNLL